MSVRQEVGQRTEEGRGTEEAGRPVHSEGRHFHACCLDGAAIWQNHLELTASKAPGGQKSVCKGRWKEWMGSPVRVRQDCQGTQA